jgi:hypothetical protein
LLTIKEPTNRNESEQVVNKGKKDHPQGHNGDFDLYRKDQQVPDQFLRNNKLERVVNVFLPLDKTRATTTTISATNLRAGLTSDRMVLSMMNMETVNSTKAREKIFLEATTAGVMKNSSQYNNNSLLGQGLFTQIHLPREPLIQKEKLS